MHTSTDAGDVQEFLPSLRKMSKDDLIKMSRSQVLLNLTKLNEIKEYTQVFHIANLLSSYGLHLSMAAQTEVVKAIWCCSSESRHGDIALNLLERLLDNKFKVRKELLNSISSVIISTKDPLLRFKFITLCRKTAFGEKHLSHIFSKSVLLYASTDEIEQAVSLIAEASTLDVDISATCYEVIIHKLLEDNDLDISLQLMKGMIDQPKKPIFTRLWGHFIAKAADVQHYQALSWAFQNGIKPSIVYPSDTVLYSMAELGFASEDQDMTIYAVKQLCDRGYADDVSLMTLAVETQAREGNIAEAFKMLTCIGKDASKIHVRDFPVLLSQLTKSDEHITTASEALFKASKNRNCHPHTRSLLMNIVCLSFIMSDRSEFGTRIYQEMRDLDFQANEDTFLVLLEMHTILGSSLGMEDLYATFVPYVIEPSHLVNEAFLLALVKSDNADKALQWLNKFKFTRFKPRPHIIQLVNDAVEDKK